MRNPWLIGLLVTFAVPFLALLRAESEKVDANARPRWPTEIRGQKLEYYVKAMRESADASEREEAIHTLPLFGPEARKAAGANLLFALTSDTDENVRLAAIDAVPILGFENKEHITKALNAMIKFVGPGSEESIRLRHETIVTLAKCGSIARHAVAALTEGALRDEMSWQNRKAAAYTLGQIGGPLFDDDGPDVKTVHALATCLRTDAAHAVRREAINSLLLIGEPQAATTAKTLRGAVAVARHDTDPFIVLWSHVLSIRAEEEPIETNNPHLVALLKCLTNADPAIKAEALKAIAVIGEQAKPGLADLIAFVKNEKEPPLLVALAIAAMTQMPSEKARIVPVIKSLLADKDPIIKQAALNACQALNVRVEPKKDDRAPTPKK